MLLEKLRNRIYWIIDKINGGHVSNHLNEINFILEHPTSLNAKKIQHSNLENLLNHAVNSTLFYKNQKKFKTILDFPVIKKNGNTR